MQRCEAERDATVHACDQMPVDRPMAKGNQTDTCFKFVSVHQVSCECFDRCCLLLNQFTCHDNTHPAASPCNRYDAAIAKIAPCRRLCQVISTPWTTLQRDKSSCSSARATSCHPPPSYRFLPTLAISYQINSLFSEWQHKDLESLVQSVHFQTTRRRPLNPEPSPPWVTGAQQPGARASPHGDTVSILRSIASALSAQIGKPRIRAVKWAC